jgi:dihydroxy-acid dehydratase
MKDKELRRYSRVVVDGVAQAPSRAMLRAVGFSEEDFKRPQIGIASTWSMITPCNMHINDLAEVAAKGVDDAGGKAVIFNTMTVSDGIAMGTPGMRYSLVSREIIADSIEAVAGAEGFDGLIGIGGCDKNMPACVMAMARLNRPSIFVYGGTIKPGAKRRDIVSVFEAVGAHAGGTVDDAELLEVEQTAIPGPGACGGMYTANTMASAIEALGMSLANSSAQEAISEAKKSDCRRAGEAVLKLIEKDIKPSDILTHEAFENAITVVTALGGSTNAVLHLLAMAREANVDLELDDFTRVGSRVPVLADVKPSGKYLMSELIEIGGIQPQTIPQGRKLFATSTIRSNPKVTWSFFTATLRPPARLPKSPAKRACVSRVRPVYFIRKSWRYRRFLTARSKPAMSSLFATRAPKAGPACARC